jgi:hypothetical protein
MAKERDWAGFFEALAKFILAVLPAILPLFQRGNVSPSRPRSRSGRSGPKLVSPPDPGQ